MKKQDYTETKNDDIYYSYIYIFIAHTIKYIFTKIYKKLHVYYFNAVCHISEQEW